MRCQEDALCSEVDPKQRYHDQADDIIYTMWKSASRALEGRDVQLAVIDRHGVHALLFPCRRVNAS